MSVFICPFCGTSKQMPPSHAAKNRTCGAPECRARYLAEVGHGNKGKEHSPEANHRKGWKRGKTESPEMTAARVAGRKASGSWFSISDIGERISAGRKASGNLPDISGPNNPNWRGGLSNLPQGYRGSLEYETWRKAVLERAGYRCEKCGTDGPVVAHHIIGWHVAPALRMSVDNGEALCLSCHSKAERFTDNLPKTAGPWPGRPAVTTILCVVCGKPRYVLTCVAHRYSTCGSRECRKQRLSERGKQSKGRGEANPNYSTGQWVRQARTCLQCGRSFVGPTHRQFCSLPCFYAHRRLR